MSTIIMSACWSLQMPPSEKAVLISLADNANDDGVCWPLIRSICERTCLCERAVRKAIGWLSDHGAISVRQAPGKGNVYRVTPELFAGMTPAPDAPHPGTSCTPASDAPLHQTQDTPAPGAPHPGTTCTPLLINRHRTVNEPIHRSSGGSSGSSGGSSRFADWWGEYPRKVKRKTALDVWRRKRLDEMADRLIADVRERMRSDRRWREGFIPDPTTYLRQERWEDEIERNGGGGGESQRARRESATEIAERWARNRGRAEAKGGGGHVIDL